MGLRAAIIVGCRDVLSVGLAMAPATNNKQDSMRGLTYARTRRKRGVLGHHAVEVRQAPAPLRETHASRT